MNIKSSKREITIYDIASELKVSPSTVSRALNNHTSISKEMIKTVKKMAVEKGYRPNNIAASLRNNKTKTIGVLVSWINRPFNSALISGIEQVASKEGYNIIISQSHDSYENEVANAAALYNSRIGGIVASLAMETKYYDHFLQFSNNNIPMVFVDRVCEEFNSDRVLIDNFSAGFRATQHLIDQGCKRIAHFAGSQHRNVYKERLNGYLEALKQNGLPVDEEIIVHSTTMSSEEGMRMTSYLFNLPVRPDGIFSSNDTSAVSAIQCAKKMGIRVPDEVAIIGFNNDPISLIVDPPLSTVSHPAVEMGKIAARQILRHLAEEEHSTIAKSETIVLNTELLIRESSLQKKEANSSL